MIQSKSAAHAKSYFNEGLSRSDYYLNDQELPGIMQGKIAARLGIAGQTTKEIFQALAENIHPKSGEKLTPRKSTNRTIGYDINFHCPKSVSILHVLTKDDHILTAFQDSVSEVMHDIERDSKTRKRLKGTNEDVITGELIWSEFIHQTARPIEGSNPDPHLHAHCYTFNVTWDEKEQRFKAAQFRDIMRDMPFYEKKFHKLLSDRLLQLGYGIRKTKSAFEIEGIPLSVIRHFSKRTDEIGRAAADNNVTDAKELDKLGSRTRAKKAKGQTMEGLLRDWRKQIHELGLNDDQAPNVIRNGSERLAPAFNDADCIDHAVSHCFERASVMQDRRILAKAFDYSIGNLSVSPASILSAFTDDQTIIKAEENGKTLCTTLDVVRQERELVGLALSGKGIHKPLYETLPPISLSAEQQAAVNLILSSQDQINIIEGRAGTGKTTLMKEAVSLIEKTGKHVTVVAPTSEAARGVLRQEGFCHAETVTKLLTDKKLQDGLTDQVLWVDEAGLVGIQELTALIKIARDNNTKVILSGDCGQHSPVARGDGLRVLQELAHVPTASLTTIYRQRHESYKTAVHSLSKGNAAEAFKILDSIEAIRSVSKESKAETIASDYVSACSKGKTALVVSPTHKQGKEVTSAIRQSFKKLKKLGKHDISVDQFINLNMTAAEKSDLRNYEQGLVIQFNQNRKGIRRGSRWMVDAVSTDTLSLVNEQKEKKTFAIEKKNDFDVFHKASLQIAKGETIRITRNSTDNDKKRLNNGQSFKVTAIKKNGDIQLESPASKARFTLPPDFGHITHGYCMTSHASQGKTVDEVFIYQPAATFPATDLKQFYVSVSRGRNKVHIYTDDKKGLIDHASVMRGRSFGLELLKFRNGLADMTGLKNTHSVSINGHAPQLS